MYCFKFDPAGTFFHGFLSCLRFPLLVDIIGGGPRIMIRELKGVKYFEYGRHQQ